MWAWFSKKPEDIRTDLTLTEEDRNLRRKAETYKQALALIMATRRPATYLGKDREQLELRMASYLPLLVEAGVLTERLAAATLEAPLRFNQRIPARKTVPFVDRKATNAVRAELLDLLDVDDLYTLDRYDLSVETSIDGTAQEKVTAVLRKLANPRHAGAMGLYGKHLLAPGNDPSKVVYSFSLYEAAADGNRLRVSADTFDKPLDINRNVKLEMGSTAKLRTMANYLTVIADLHETYRRTPREVLAGVEQAALDPISRWTAGYVRMNPGVSLQRTLEASLERSFSTDTAEGFFTGSGLHYFSNFGDSLVAESSLRNAFQHSINLVYIRLMREIEQYYVAKLDYDQKAILANLDHPQRAELLDAALEIEARDNLRSYFRRYGKSSFEQSLARMCGKEARGLRRLAIFALAEEPQAPYERLRELARRTYPEMSAAQDSLLRGYYRTFAGKIHSAQDEAYLLGRDPLEVWMVRDRRDHPTTNWADVLRRSAEARSESTRWIRTRHFKEAQNLRIRTELERRAFMEIHKQWRALGYSFDSLVPSLATAIGSSADRPQSLAELVGIIQRGGKRVPFLRVESLHFGEGTPYETHFEPAQGAGEQVMAPEVAAALEKLMRGVVEGGTARRVHGCLRTAGGKTIPIGGKTGSGDNRYEKFAANGALISSRAINRTASFVFVVGERYFGMISAYVDGEVAGEYSFTSTLALQAFRHVADAIEPLVRGGEAQAGLAAADGDAPASRLAERTTSPAGAPVGASAAPAVAALATATPASAAVAVADRR
jgi:membrane peptidoglycan carboxypeptidase